MKKAKKILVLALSAALVATTFAACSADPSDDVPSTSEPPAMTDPVTEAPTEAPAETPTEAPSEAPAAPAVPSTQAEMIAAYNKALSASSLSCTSVVQTITKGSLSALGQSIDIMAPEQDAVRTSCNRNDTNGVSIPQLQEANVKSATLVGTTLTILLNDTSAASANAADLNGYFNFVDDTRAAQIIDTAKNSVNDKATASVKAQTLSLANGKIEAVFNEDFTQITSLKHSYTESLTLQVKAKLGVAGLDLDSEFQCDGTSEYTA